MEKIPIRDKYLLTIEEASAYSNIGVCRLREITRDSKCPFVVYVGNKRLVKRKQFEKFLDGSYSIV